MKQTLVRLRALSKNYVKAVANINVAYFVAMMLVSQAVFAQVGGPTGLGGLCSAKTWVYAATNVGAGVSIVWKGLGALSAHRHGGDVMHEIYGMLPGAAVALLGNGFVAWFAVNYC